MQQYFVVDSLAVLELDLTVNSIIDLAGLHNFSASVRLYEVVTHGTLHFINGKVNNITNGIPAEIMHFQSNTITLNIPYHSYAKAPSFLQNAVWRPGGGNWGGHSRVPGH
jgi:hypothetical protein